MVYHVVSDSSCDLLHSEFISESVGFTSVPLHVCVGEHELVDDDTLDVSELLCIMREEKASASSACPSPADYAGAFSKGEKIVCFTISSGVSGSFNAALQGRALALEKHPEKGIIIGY